MDRVIKKKKWNTKRILTIAGITAIIILIAGSYYFTSGKSRLNVDTERLTISEIKKGSFQEFIPVNGIVLPVTTIYLDAVEGGRVEEKYVDDGAVMIKGQPILRLSNTDLAIRPGYPANKRIQPAYANADFEKCCAAKYSEQPNADDRC